MQVNNFNWDATLTSILQMAGAEGVTATGTVNDAGQLVLNVITQDGRTSTVTMDPPEIDDVGVALTEEGQQELVGKLSELAGENLTLEQAMADPTIGKLFFDMAELMKLMQEIAQEQKKNARTQRESELQVEIAAIKNQAERQRDAAKYALITSCVTMAMQIAAIGVSIGITSAAAKKQNTQLSQSGLKAAQADLKTTSKSVSNSKFATQNAENTHNALTPTELDDFNRCMLDSTQADSKLTMAQQKAIQPGHTEVDVNAVDVAKTDLASKLDAACDKIDTDVENTRMELAAAKDELAKIPDTSSEHLKKEMAVTSLEQKLKRDENVQKAVHAKSLAMKKTHGMETSLQGDLKKAQTRVDGLDREVTLSDEWRSAEKSVRTAGIINDVMAACKGLFDAMTNIVRSEAEAKATEESAEQKESQARYEEISEMMRTAQEVISSVLQMYQAMLQAEAQSLEQIIRA